MFDLGEQRALLGCELRPLANGDLGRGEVSEVAGLPDRERLAQASKRAQQLLAFARERVACGFESWWIECTGTLMLAGIRKRGYSVKFTGENRA